MRKITLGIVTLAILTAGAYWWNHTKSANKTSNQNNTSQTEKTQSDAAAFNKKQFSLTDPNSIWLVVNKRRALPEGFAPSDLGVPDVRLRLDESEQQMQMSQKAIPALKEMFAAAQADRINLVFGSGYRSEALQKQFYDSYVASDGREKADTYSARPGHSEHQTGLTVDLTSPNGSCHLEICWENTPEGKWVAANAYRYGFIIRYPNGKENITGYQYEPWHVRYVGKDLSNELHKTNQTMEEFFELGPAVSYD